MQHPLRIKSIDMSSPAYIAGIRAGDTIVAVNGNEIMDELDFVFSTAQENLAIEIDRKGNHKTFTLYRRSGTTLGIDFRAQPVHRCNNRCIFCFIDQMPERPPKRPVCQR